MEEAIVHGGLPPTRLCEHQGALRLRGSRRTDRLPNTASRACKQPEAKAGKGRGLSTEALCGSNACGGLDQETYVYAVSLVE